MMLGWALHGGHLRRQDAGGAIERREGLVELGHVPADGRLAFHQVDVLAGVGQGQRGVDAGDAAAHHQHAELIGTRAAPAACGAAPRRTAARIRSLALRSPPRLSVCTQESCSRMLTIWK